MWVQPVLLEDVQVQQRIPRRGRLGKRVGLAGARIQAIAAHAVTTLDLHEGWLLDGRAEGRPRLHPPQSAGLIGVLDRRWEAHPVWQAQGRSAASPRTDRLAIGTQQLLRVGPPPVAAPGERLSRRALLGLRKHPGHQLLLAWPAGMGHHEAAGAVDHQTAPARPRLARLARLASWRRRLHRGGHPIRRRIADGPSAVLLRTKDQHSSTSRVESRQSCTSTWVIPSAWRAARYSHWLSIR